MGNGIINSSRCDDMFMNFTNLEEVDLSFLNTEKTESMFNMFKGCSYLTKLNLKNFDTSNVITMRAMFYGCSSLKELQINNFNTEKVRSTESMFDGCTSLRNLDLTSFDTKQVTNTYHMFYGCTNLSKIYVSDKWTMDLVTGTVDGNGMFGGCLNLVGSLGTTYDSLHVGKDYARIDEGVYNPGYLSKK